MGVGETLARSRERRLPEPVIIEIQGNEQWLLAYISVVSMRWETESPIREGMKTLPTKCYGRALSWSPSPPLSVLLCHQWELDCLSECQTSTDGG